MSDKAAQSLKLSRRRLVQATGGIAAGAAFAGTIGPRRFRTEKTRPAEPGFLGKPRAGVDPLGERRLIVPKQEARIAG